MVLGVVEVVLIGFVVASVHRVGVAAHKLQHLILLFKQVGLGLDRTDVGSNAALQNDM